MGVTQRPLGLALLYLMRIGALQRARALNRRNGCFHVTDVRLARLGHTRIELRSIPRRVERRIRCALSRQLSRQFS